MQLTKDQALHIAIYLYSGAYKDKCQDISINIGEGKEIGIKSTSKRSALYVKKDGKADKSAMVEPFDATISIKDLAKNIMAITENADTFKGEKLDLSSLPVIPEDVLNSYEDDFDDVDTDIHGDENADYFVAEENENTAEDDDYYEPGADNETIIDPETATETPAENIKEEDFILVGEMAFSDEDLNNIFDDADTGNVPDPLEVTVSHHVAVKEKETEPQEDKKMENKKITVKSADVKNADDATVQAISDNSYLYTLMTDGRVDLSDEVTTIFKKLKEVSPERAAQVYITGVLYALDAYGNDAEKMSDDLDVDMRNISIALLEQEFCK